MESVVVGSAGVSITFASGHRDMGGYAEILDVTVKGPDLQAGLSVYAGLESGFDHLVSYFEDLERGFAGWQGERVFESIERDFRIAAIHDGRIRLSVRLSQYVTRNSWTVETTVVLEAGEELSRAVRDLAGLVRPRPSD